MNKARFLVILVLLTPLFCLSQEIVLSSIKVPGSTSVGVISGAVLDENLLGPRKIIFFSEQGDLQKRQAEKKSSGIGAETSQSEKIPTLYSGRIFSPGIIEPFVFKDKTKEELTILEVKVFPIRLEEPYTLYIDLTVQASSPPVKSNKSVDAGDYTANLSINLIQF
jgi:hypothetical protein